MNELPTTRQSLVIRLRERSDAAWFEFTATYGRAITGFARRRGLQQADAQDVTQEVLAALDAKLGEWQMDTAKGSLRAWLFSVARNITVDKVAERQRLPRVSGSAEGSKLLEETPANETTFHEEYRRSLLYWAAEQVRPTVKRVSWEAFWLTAIEGLSAEKVAKQLNTTAGSVYAAKFRIVTRIRQLVERIDDVEEAAERLRDFPGGA